MTGGFCGLFAPHSLQDKGWGAFFMLRAKELSPPGPGGHRVDCGADGPQQTNVPPLRSDGGSSPLEVRMLHLIRSLWRRLSRPSCVHLVDGCLLLFLAVLLVQSACSLLFPETGGEMVSGIDVIVRTSSASIFGYLLSANFNRRESGENPSSAASPALPVIQTGDGGEQPRAQIGFALPGDQGELQSGGAAGEPAPSAREDSCRLQVLAATAVGLFCLVTLLVLRAAALKRPDLLASDAATATVAQFRDFVSGCVGFLIGCPTGKSGSTGS